MGFVSRTLAEDDVYDAPPDTELETLDDSNSENLRIAAIFIVLTAGLLGGVPSLFIKKFQQLQSLPGLFVRSLAAGIIVSLAIVHIIPEAFGSMDLVVEDYPVGSCCVLFGIFILLLLEKGFHTIADQQGESGAKEHSHQNVQLSIAASEEPSKSGRDQLSMDAPDLNKVDAVSAENGQASSIPDDASEVSTTHRKIVATVMELGCIFHSVLIGVAVGVTTSRSEVVALVIALSFHQLLEGLALGSVVAAAMFPVWKGLVMVLGYSLTAPMGVGIGIGVVEMYNEDDIATAAVQGVLNGVSGGMLLYISLVQIIATDFSHTNLAGRGAVLRFCIMFCATMLGAAFMCVLALWL